MLCLCFTATISAGFFRHRSSVSKQIPVYHISRSKYVTRPIKHIGNISFQDAVYTPPLLPSHITVKLEPVAGTPSDEEIIRVHNVVHSYEQLSSCKGWSFIILSSSNLTAQSHQCLTRVPTCNWLNTCLTCNSVRCCGIYISLTNC